MSGDGEFFSAIVGALVGAFAGGVITAWQNTQASKLQNTLSLINEWHSSEMRRCRATAERTFDSHGEHGLLSAMSATAQAISATVENIRNEGLQTEHSISQVVHYFEKFQVLLKAGQLEKRIAAEGMGGIVRWWSRKLLAQIDLSTYSGDWKKLLSRVAELDRKIGRDM